PFILSSPLLVGVSRDRAQTPYEGCRPIFTLPFYAYPARRPPMPGSAWERRQPTGLPYTGRVITVTNVWKAFGPQDLFTGADLRVGARERVALVGPNGSGKTTLFEMLAGTESPDRGEIAVLKQADIGYLRQEADLLEGRSLLQEVLSAATEVEETNHKLAVLEAELEECPEGEGRARVLAEHAEV